jgi:ABC-type multidrug transport system fused ATPase/permease subunit
MILELEDWETRMYIVILVIFIILFIIVLVGAVKESHNKNQEIKSIEEKTKAKMTDYYNTTMQKLANDIHSYNAEARERERQEWNREKQNLIRKLKEENPFAIKYELGQVVYVFKDHRIYKDNIREIKVNKLGIKYTGIILKNIEEKYIYATFDDLCNDNKLNKDDILMYAYNNDRDKKERRIEC